MSMEIPVITNTGVGDVDTILQESNAGILVPTFTPKAYEEAVTHVDDLLKADRSAVRAYTIAHFGIEKGIESYDRIYSTLL